MDIKRACNTPVLTKKIIGSSTISKSFAGIIKNQPVTITYNNDLNINNPIINITSTEISYSKLGLFNLPVISTTDKLNSIKYSNDYSIINPKLSILDSSKNLKSMYDNIITEITNSQNSKDSISKETYLLLSLQSLSDFIITVCSEFINNIVLKSQEHKTYFIDLILKLLNSLFSISSSLKLLNALIGQSTITLKYSDKIINKLTSALSSIESFIANLDNNKLNIDDDILYSINSALKECKDLLVIDKTSKILFSQFTNLVLNYTNCINLLINQLLRLNSSITQEPLTNIISSLENITKLIDLAVSSISLAYYNINDDYYNIIDNLKYACDYAKLISFNSQCPNLFTNFKSNILLSKTYINNIKIQDPLDINNTTISSILTEDINLSLSFYVYNLNIKISGTINSVNFIGTISYPELYNLNFFGINDVIIATKISILSNTNKFSISQCLTLNLNIKNITIHPQNNASSPSTFIADINFSLLVNGEVIATSLVPLIISK